MAALQNEPLPTVYAELWWCWWWWFTSHAATNGWLTCLGSCRDPNRKWARGFLRLDIWLKISHLGEPQLNQCTEGKKVMKVVSALVFVQSCLVALWLALSPNRTKNHLISEPNPTLYVGFFQFPFTVQTCRFRWREDQTACRYDPECKCLSVLALQRALYCVSLPSTQAETDSMIMSIRNM